MSDMAEGFYLVGTFLGVERARSFTRKENGETVNVRPRLGVMVNDEEVEVAVKDDAQLEEVAKGLAKGQPIRLVVEVRPPFGARGGVSYSLPGVIVTRHRWG